MLSRSLSLRGLWGGKAKPDEILTAETQVFGIPLRDAAKKTDRISGMIPSPVRKGVEYLNAKGLDEEGLYRTSGSQSKFFEYREAFDKGQEVDFIQLNERLCENVAMVIVKYLKALPEGDVLNGMQEAFREATADAVNGKETGESMSKLKELLALLPQENRETLIFLADHLRMVSAHSAANKMTLDALTTTWVILMGEVIGYLLKLMIKNPDLCRSTLVFGVPLEIAASRSEGGVIPAPLRLPIEYLETSHLVLSNLYQWSGEGEFQADSIMQWKEKFNRGWVTVRLAEPKALETSIATNIVKEFVHNVPVSIFPKELHDPIREISKLTDKGEKLKKLKDLVNAKFSGVERGSIGMLAYHLNEIVEKWKKEHEDTAKNEKEVNMFCVLAGVFGSHYVEMLPPFIEFAKEVFPEQEERRKGTAGREGKKSPRVGRGSGGVGSAKTADAVERVGKQGLMSPKGGSGGIQKKKDEIITVKKKEWESMLAKIKSLEEENRKLKKLLQEKGKTIGVAYSGKPTGQRKSVRDLNSIWEEMSTSGSTNATSNTTT